MMTKKLATIRGMTTVLAVLVTCLHTACGGGNGSADVSDPLSFANAGGDVPSTVVSAAGNEPIHNWIFSALWLALVALLAFLMVSTWRYPSFKDLSLTQPRSPLSVILLGSLIYLIWNFSQPVLLVLAMGYVASGIAIRLGGLIRRRFRPPAQPPPEPSQAAEHPIG